jgi:hypothetical protein
MEVAWTEKNTVKPQHIVTVYCNLLRYIEGGGKSKSCIMGISVHRFSWTLGAGGSIPSEALSGFDCMVKRSCYKYQQYNARAAISISKRGEQFAGSGAVGIVGFRAVIVLVAKSNVFRNY